MYAITTCAFGPWGDDNCFTSFRHKVGWPHHQEFQINQNIYFKLGVYEMNTKHL